MSTTTWPSMSSELQLNVALELIIDFEVIEETNVTFDRLKYQPAIYWFHPTIRTWFAKLRLPTVPSTIFPFANTYKVLRNEILSKSDVSNCFYWCDTCTWFCDSLWPGWTHPVEIHHMETWFKGRIHLMLQDLRRIQNAFCYLDTYELTIGHKWCF